MNPVFPNPDFSLDAAQRRCHITCTETCDNLDYPMHEMGEEYAEAYDKFFQSLPDDVREGDVQLRAIHTAIMHAGQLCKARAKAVRRGEVANPVMCVAGSLDQRKELVLEIGDVFWGMCESLRKLGFKLSECAQLVLMKLADRQERNKIVGDGDHR